MFEPVGFFFFFKCVSARVSLTFLLTNAFLPRIFPPFCSAALKT